MGWWVGVEGGAGKSVAGKEEAVGWKRRSVAVATMTAAPSLQLLLWRFVEVVAVVVVAADGNMRNALAPPSRTGSLLVRSVEDVCERRDATGGA